MYIFIMNIWIYGPQKRALSSRSIPQRAQIIYIWNLSPLLEWTWNSEPSFVDHKKGLQVLCVFGGKDSDIWALVAILLRVSQQGLKYQSLSHKRHKGLKCQSLFHKKAMSIPQKTLFLSWFHKRALEKWKHSSKSPANLEIFTKEKIGPSFVEIFRFWALICGNFQILGPQLWKFSTSASQRAQISKSIPQKAPYCVGLFCKRDLYSSLKMSKSIPQKSPVNLEIWALSGMFLLRIFLGPRHTTLFL